MTCTCGFEIGEGLRCPSCGASAPTYLGEIPSSGKTPVREPDLAIKTTLAGRYVLEDLLGTGGFGAVYRAHDLVVGEPIAIKILQPNPDRDPSEVKRFKRELLTSRRISHPNVIRIHDMGSLAGGELFISMEILGGGPLSRRIRQGPIPPIDGLRIAIGMAEGLAAAHAKGVVHRDLKPDNVLFDDAGEPKLVDFGLARLVDSRSRTVGFSGTPFYMSPEHAAGTDGTTASDLYSLGVVLFELFTGRLPFQADSLVRIAVLHATEPPPKPRAIRPELPPSIEKIVLRCLEKDPGKRPESAAALASALREVRTALLAPELSPPPRAARRSRKPELLLGAMGLLAAVGLLLPALPRGARTGSTTPAGTPVAVATTPAAAPAATTTVVAPAPAVTPAPSRRVYAARATPAPARVALAATSAAKMRVSADGDCTGSCWVSVRVDGGTPQYSECAFDLPPGRHAIVIERPEAGLRYDDVVTIPEKPSSPIVIDYRVVRTGAKLAILRVRG